MTPPNKLSLMGLNLALVLILLFLSSTQCYAMSFQHAAEIYKNIKKANGWWITPTLEYSPSEEVNAYSDGHKVVLYQGILDYVKTDEEMALIISHEVAHIKLWHVSSTPKNEYAADALGGVFMKRAGYDICTGAQYFKRRNSPNSETHPAGILRYQALGCS